MSQVLITESYLTGIANAIRGRNGTQNTYTPPQMAAAVTAIPNSYAAGDEGKVVSNGALVTQTTHAEITENGTYDITTNNSVTVNVSGGGGSSGAVQVSAMGTDVDSGYVGGGSWTTTGITPNTYYSDVYEVTNGHFYVIRLGADVGNRFRAMFSTTNVIGATSNVQGTAVGADQNDPPAYAYKSVIFEAMQNGYLTVGKSSNGQSGIQTYVYDITGIML